MARASHYSKHREGILAAINKAHAEHGKPPSVRELADQFEVGVASMHSYLTKLSEEGLIEWRTGKHRSLKCTPLGIQQAS